jgi:outer membrane protein TolC
MIKQLPRWRCFRILLVGGLALPVFLSSPLRSQVEERPELFVPKNVAIIDAAPRVIEAAPPQQAVKLDLPSCRRIALERQPGLAAARATLAAAQARQQALEHLHLAGVVRHDLPIRRSQACLGVQVAQAQLTQAEWETIYAVTRTYVGVLYAQAQLRVADRVLSDTPEGLPFLRDLAADVYKNRTRPDVKAWNVDQIEVYISIARGRREEGLEGLERAKAGLREAMGVGPDFPLDLADQRMPQLNVTVESDQVLALALERRGEVQQANLAAEITNCEVKAQGTSLHPKLETFASSADIHAQPAPQGVRNGEYRPGAINIEMPTELVGHRSDRVQQAQAYAARAAAVAEKTRNLVSIEARSGFLRWQETKNQVKEYGDARDRAKQIYDTLRGERGFDPKDKAGGKPTLDDLLNSAIQASQTEVQANQVIYQHLLSLAALERMTAGGINPGFETLAPTPADNGPR